MKKTLGFSFINNTSSENDIQSQIKKNTYQNNKSSVVEPNVQRKFMIDTNSSSLINLKNVRNVLKHQKNFFKQTYSNKNNLDIESIENLLLQNQCSSKLSRKFDKQQNTQVGSQMHSRENSANDQLISRKNNKENIQPNKRKPKKQISPRKSLVPSQKFQKIFSKNSLKLDFEPQLFKDFKEDLITARQQNHTLNALNFEQTVKLKKDQQVFSKLNQTTRFRDNSRIEPKPYKRKNTHSTCDNFFKPLEIDVKFPKRKSEQNIKNSCLRQIQKITKNSSKDVISNNFNQQPKHSQIVQHQNNRHIIYNNSSLTLSESKNQDNFQEKSSQNPKYECFNEIQRPNSPDDTQIGNFQFDKLLQRVNIGEKEIDDFLLNIEFSEQIKNQCKVENYQTMKPFQLNEQALQNCYPQNFVERNFFQSPKKARQSSFRQDVKKLSLKNNQTSDLYKTVNGRCIYDQRS